MIPKCLWQHLMPAALYNHCGYKWMVLNIQHAYFVLCMPSYHQVHWIFETPQDDLILLYSTDWNIFTAWNFFSYKKPNTFNVFHHCPAYKYPSKSLSPLQKNLSNDHLMCSKLDHHTTHFFTSQDIIQLVMTYTLDGSHQFLLLRVLRAQVVSPIQLANIHTTTHSAFLF